MRYMDRRPSLPDQLGLVRRGLKFSQLRLIAALRDFGQIGAAAEFLGMTQPGASRLLAQLEVLAEASLYTRHARGVTLTDAGRILADRAAQVLKDMELSGAEISEVVRGLSGSVRVGSVTGPSLDLLLPVVRDLREAYPEIDVGVEVETSQVLSEFLLAETLDFYIGRIPDGADARPFRFAPIGEEQISLLVRLDHPLTRKPDLTIEDCLDYDWVTQPPGGLLRRTAEDYLLARNLPLPPRVLSTASTLFTLAMINVTDAIAPLASAVADFFTQQAGLGSRLAKLPVAPDLAVKPYGLVQRSSDLLSPSAQRVFSLLESAAGRSG